MRNRGTARDAAAFLMAGAIALFGGAVLFKAGSASLAPMSGGAPGAAPPGISLIVLLLGVAGLILVMMAGKEFLALRRRP